MLKLATLKGPLQISRNFLMMLQLVARRTRCAFLRRLVQVLLLLSVYWVHKAHAESQLIAHGHYQAAVLSSGCLGHAHLSDVSSRCSLEFNHCTGSYLHVLLDINLYQDPASDPQDRLPQGVSHQALFY